MPRYDQVPNMLIVVETRETLVSAAVGSGPLCGRAVFQQEVMGIRLPWPRLGYLFSDQRTLVGKDGDIRVHRGST